MVSNSNDREVNIALAGNPNSGKSTLFNILTGLNQNIGNFPGVTVDKKTGAAKIIDLQNGKTINAKFIDLPGTYSLYPKSIDERVSFEVLCDPENVDFPDITIIVADASNLKRNLFLASQIIDLKAPVILALNMMDLLKHRGIEIDIELLSKKLGVCIVPIDARRKQGIDNLKQAISKILPVPENNFIDINSLAPEVIEKIKKIVTVKSDYAAFQIANNFADASYFNYKSEHKAILHSIVNESGFDKNKLQALETVARYKVIDGLLKDCVKVNDSLKKESLTYKLDKILTHKFWGYLIFLFLLFIIFQTIFFLAAYPMQWIETLFKIISDKGLAMLPGGVLTELLINGVLAGLSGVVVFVPQIALLFAFIAILEDTGYMARVSFIMDKLMRKFGLNGKSVIPLISGTACAIPAIMSARTIGNWKERMITIMITPLISCSARLPVYTLLISLVIPSDKALGFFNMQGFVLMALYLIGFVAAIVVAWIMKFLLKARERSYFIMEMPIYRSPRWASIGLTILDKVKIFLFDAGKIIVAISVILWVLSSHASGDKFEKIDKKYQAEEMTKTFSASGIKHKIAAEKLEASYAGALGKSLEPIIAPLGFDWKIGIALVTSFAAREVFVGTMATIYSVGDEGNNGSIREKMAGEINPLTGEKKYTAAVGLSLMIFYAFAMQCMSTIAVVYRETKNWKWPLIQFVYMGVLAYVSSFVVFHIFK